jgi:hypothetical protein
MSDISSLLERFRRGPELIALVMTGVYGDEEDFVPAPGKWSIRQVLAHLADSEVACGWRLRMVIAQENAALTAYDQEAWARHLGYSQRKPKTSLESFRRGRAENYELLRELPEAVYDERAGMHEEAGRMTLRELVERNANHTENHARQIQEIREGYKQAKGKK